MNTFFKKPFFVKSRGSTLALVLILLVMLLLIGLAMLTASKGNLIEAVRIKSLESASAAAEAAYENAVFWMSQQIDMLDAIKNAGGTISITFPESSADYKISFAKFIGSRPVFKVEANGYRGIYQKKINAYLVQAIAGWEMGKCRIISDTAQTTPVYFVNGEIVTMPIHINDLMDNPDNADIYITGSPQFLERVSMGEPRHTAAGSDKYASQITKFPHGIAFGQPASRIVDYGAVSTKLTRFRDSTNPTYQFTPEIHKTLPKDNTGANGFYATVTELPAVHLKFYVKNNQGFVRIYNHCTVAGYTRGGTSTSSWDYKINPSDPDTSVKYPIYGCHYSTDSYIDVQIDDQSSPIYVSQSFNGVSSEPGAQIYVNGNVIIGCSSEDAGALGTLNTVKGRVSIVATDTIWIANQLKIDGTRQANGMPASDNPNVIGLISQGVVKVVDPGMTTNNLLYNKSSFDAARTAGYIPIGNSDAAESYSRVLPETMTVEAAITVGGGGWGAENVYRSSSYPGRKKFNTASNDILIVRGTLTEAIRGIVGNGTNGYIKQYYYDQRLTSGILPSNIWLKGKYILIPGGWSEESLIKSQ